MRECLDLRAGGGRNADVEEQWPGQRLVAAIRDGLRARQYAAVAVVDCDNF